MNKLLDYRESCMKEDRLKERAEKAETEARGCWKDLYDRDEQIKGLLAELAIHEENMPKAYGKILDLKAELAEAKKYDGTREDIRSLQELLDFRTAERDKALDLRDSIERKLLCEVRDLRELLAELLEAYEGQCAMGSECELTAAVRDALAGKGGE